MHRHAAPSWLHRVTVHGALCFYRDTNEQSKLLRTCYLWKGACWETCLLFDDPTDEESDIRSLCRARSFQNRVCVCVCVCSYIFVCWNRPVDAKPYPL